MQYQFTSPDKKKYLVNAPEGATEEQAFQMLQASLGQAEIPEIEQKSPIESFKETAGEALEAGKNIVKETYELGQSAGAGAATIPGELAKFGTEFLENLAAAPGYIYSKAIGEEPKDTPHMLSDWMDKQNKYLKGMLRPETQGPYDKLVEKLASYSVPTAATTQATIKAGKSLQDLAKVAPETVGTVESVLLQYAKDPKASHGMEQSVSAAMATAGSIAEDMGFELTGQLTAELAAGIVTGKIVNEPKAITNWIRSFSGKEKAANYFKEIADADPEFAEKLARGIELEEKTGVKMNLGELTNNPELKAMATALEAERAGTWTAADSRLKQQTKRIEKAFPVDKKTERIAQEKAIAAREKTVEALEKELADAISNIVDEIDKVAPISRVQAGETGRVMLQNAREEAQSKINALYEDIGNPKLDTDQIRAAINKVKRTELQGYDFKGMMDANTQRIIETNFGKKAPQQQTLGAIRELEEMVGREIGLARVADDPQKARMFSLILSGIRQQYRTAKGIAREDAQKLRSAARASKKMHDLFDQGSILLTSKVDTQNIKRISTEDFINTFIRPDSLSKTANIEKNVQDFYNAYGNIKESRDYMANAFGALMKEQLGESPKPQDINKFIRRYDRFLSEANIKDRFSNVTKASKIAKEADTALTLDEKNFKNSIIGKFLEVDDPAKFVINQVKNRKIGRLMNEVNEIKNPKERKVIKDGINELMWDAIQNEMTTTKAIDDIMLMTTGGIRQALKSYSNEFTMALGGKHTEQLEDILDIVDRVSPVSGGAKLDALDPKLVEKAFTGMRAAAHGFVRPDLIAAQLGMRGIKAFREKTARNIMREAMNNSEFAEELIKLSKNREGREIIGAMFAPLSVVPSAIVESKNE